MKGRNSVRRLPPCRGKPLAAKRPGSRENGCRGVCCLFNIQDCFGFTRRVSAMVNTSGTPL